jgi:hypothetical protein
MPPRVSRIRQVGLTAPRVYRHPDFHATTEAYEIRRHMEGEWTGCPLDRENRTSRGRVPITGGFRIGVVFQRPRLKRKKYPTDSDGPVSKTRSCQARRWCGMDVGSDPSGPRGTLPCCRLARSVPRPSCIDPAQYNPGPIRRTRGGRSQYQGAYESFLLFAFICRVSRRLHSTIWRQSEES